MHRLLLRGSVRTLEYQCQVLVKSLDLTVHVAQKFPPSRLIGGLLLDTVLGPADETYGYVSTTSPASPPPSFI